MKKSKLKKISVAALLFAVIGMVSILNVPPVKAVDYGNSLTTTFPLVPTDVKVAKNSSSDPDYRLQFSYTLPNDPNYSCINIYRNTEFLGGQLSDRVVSCANKDMKPGASTGYFPYDDLYIKDKSSGTISFTVKAVDTAGNESTNTDKYSYSWDTPPSITVLSPNGGEQWIVGETKRITWQASNFSSTDKVRIYIDITDINSIGSGVSNYVTDQVISASQGYYDWTITQNQLPYNSTLPHQYKIRISKSVDPYTIYDSSDAPFSIAAANPPVVSEQVKCVFNGSQAEQKCYAASRDDDNISCSGKESCVADIKRAKGESVTWKSTCGGYAYTIMDGENEFAGFDCATVVAAPPKPGDTSTNPPKPTESDIKIIDMKYNAKNIVDDKYDAILSELRQLRDTIKEQQNEIKYLKSMTSDLRDISDKMKSAINDFITYGVDSNTVKLGAGERAAVINSYKSAFDKLPETEAELTDAIKIANGRFPSLTSERGEKQAKEQFIKIYKREADLNDSQDNAAIKVMAYGLRQKAENRNLNSEKAGIKIFRNIYGRTPKTTTDWNIMQAITYSGAAR